MTTRFRRSILVLVTTIFIMQTLFIPVGIVFAETTMDTEEQELVELPPMKNYLEDEQISDPRFFFTGSRMQGTAEEPLQVTFFSDQELSEVRVFLPEEATLLKDQLPTGISVEGGAQPNEWIVQSKCAQNTFVLPLVVEQVGSYELSVEETTAHLEISEKEEMSEEVPVEETESSDEDQAGQEELKEENGIDEEQENEQPAEEVREPVSEAPQEQQIHEGETDEESEMIKSAFFDGETAEVTTMAQFREAVANPDIGIISVQANLTEASANIMIVDRPLFIQGNGHTLTFGNNGFYFQLSEVNEATTLRIENASITKVGTTPLVNGTTESSSDWTLELEDITEINTNAMRLVALPEGRVTFTGGNSNFTRTTSTQTFMEVKEILVANQSKVTISRGNATIFYSSENVVAPTLTIENGSAIAITTTGGVASVIDFRGDNPKINLQSNGELSISTIGSTAIPTNTTNNTISLSGMEPKITLNEGSKLTATSTLAKRGLHLAGNNAEIIVNDSELTVTSVNQVAINLVGDNSLFSLARSNGKVTATGSGQGLNLSGATSEVNTVDAELNIATTTGVSVNLSGEDPLFQSENTKLEIQSTTGQRLNLIGINPKLDVRSSQLTMNASTGRGVYLQGTTPQVFLTDSSFIMTNTGASQGMILQGEDALLSLNKNSEYLLTGGGTGTLENIQIGNNNARPQLSLSGGSKLKITTTSGTGAATDTVNNGIHLRGAEPKVNLTEKSELEVAVTSNARRGLYLNGSEATLNVSDSRLGITTISGQGLNLSGAAPKVNTVNAEVNIATTTGVGIHLSGEHALLQNENSKLEIQSTTGQRLNLIGINPKLDVRSSQLTMNASTGRGIYLQGSTPQVFLTDSSLIMTDTGASQGMILQGEDALLSLSKDSEYLLTGGGTGTLENIQIGSNNARPKLNLEGHSKLEITATSGTSAGSATANNALHLRGNEPEIKIIESSSIAININSGNRRGIALTGATANTKIDTSEVSINTNGNGVGYYSSGLDNTLTIENSSWDANGVGGQNIHIQGNNSELTIGSSSTVKTNTSSAGSIWLNGSYPKLNVSDEGTSAIFSSTAPAAYTTATVYLGTGSGASPGAEINVSKSSSVEVISNLATTIGLWSENAQFNLTENAQLIVKQGASSATASGAAAAVRFMEFGRSSFVIDDAKMRIEQTGGSTPGMRMFGSNNAINVRNGGEFTVYNPGNGSASNGGTGVNNQGISYPGGTNNSFSIEGIGSSVNIIAESGPALDMGTSSPTLNVKNGGVFRAEGRTATAAGGIFTASVIDVNFDNPLYMNFQNNRSGGGNIFNVSTGSKLNATNSDLAVWKNGEDLTGDPTLNFRSIDYSFGGVNFNTLVDTSDPDQLNTSVFGTTGLTAYTRLSSNNARWAIADELRVPTNADKKIYGHVSLPVGLYSNRSAWTDEAIVTIQVETIDGDKKEYSAKTVGDSENKPGISIYGEEPRGGLFEVDLKEPLEAGSKVRISKVELTSGELTDGFEHQILTDTVEVFPIIPPTPARFSSSIIAQDSTRIQGRTDNLEAEVTATHNGKPLNTEDITIDDKGYFTLDLSEVSLATDDEIQVFLRDTEGSAIEAGVINPPETNNARGNINPAAELTFHDVTFEPATTLIVEDNTPRLTLEASPAEGGTPVALSYKIPPGGTTIVNAMPNDGYRFIRWEVVSGEATFEDEKEPDTYITVGEEDVTARAVFAKEGATVPPVDPLDPEVEVDPENKPELPEDQGLLSIDFVSQFNFGSQSISASDETYYAQTQRLLNTDGTVNEEEERPNYIQVSDRRSQEERNGWQLAVTQEKQFEGENGQELLGAQLSFMNQELVTAQGGETPSLQVTNSITLIPNRKRTLVRAEGSEGTGTWVYRFGDAETADKSVALTVPKGANPEAIKYSTTLTWELSAVPEN